jgi:hypothetical protein
MKRLITMSVGALVLSQFLASTALAAPECFTTGPLENALGGTVDKPRHHFVDISADASRPCSVIINSAISTSRLLGY